MSYTLLSAYSHYSLLKSCQKPKSLVNTAKELGIRSVGLVDLNSISGIIDFANEAKKADLKPLFGVTLNVDGSYLRLFARNIRGWKYLIKTVSLSHDSLIDEEPFLRLDQLESSDDVIAVTGFRNSSIYNVIFSSASYIPDYSLSSYVEGDPKEKVYAELSKIADRFNVYIQNPMGDGTLQSKLAAEIYHSLNIGKEVILGTNDSYYSRKEDEIIQRILLAIGQRTTLDKLDCYTKNAHIFSSAELLECGYTEQELENTNALAESIEQFNIFEQPKLPRFAWTNGQSEMEYLTQLCREGYKKKVRKDWDRNVYGDRVKEELETIKRADLSGYTLIVADYVNWAKSQNILVGPGRGSGAGSLVCYLMNITEIDPIPYNLIFSRYYNEGRNTKDNRELPDLDLDFPKSRREDVVNYVRNRYGHDYVAGMITFGRLMGAGALKEVLRVNKACSFDEMNKITKEFPTEAEVADDIEDVHNHSIIQWILENKPEMVQDYCRLEDGVLQGDYAQYFGYAIELEGTFKTQGTHAAGIVISPEPLSTICPMINNKNSNEKICGFDMNDAKKVGLVKFDFLGLACLDKLSKISDIVNNTN